MIKSIGALLFLAGILCLAGGTVGCIGYALYLAAIVEMTVVLSLWTAFKLWMVVMVGGFISYILGAFLVQAD